MGLSLWRDTIGLGDRGHPSREGGPGCADGVAALRLEERGTDFSMLSCPADVGQSSSPTSDVCGARNVQGPVFLGLGPFSTFIFTSPFKIIKNSVIAGSQVSASKGTSPRQTFPPSRCAHTAPAAPLERHEFSLDKVFMVSFCSI